jgi:hypothetical protein
MLPSPFEESNCASGCLSVEMAGLKGVKNGKLIKAAEGLYDVLITADKNLRYQQDLAKRKLRLLSCRLIPGKSCKR